MIELGKLEEEISAVGGFYDAHDQEKRHPNIVRHEFFLSFAPKSEYSGLKKVRASGVLVSHALTLSVPGTQGSRP